MHRSRALTHAVTKKTEVHCGHRTTGSIVCHHSGWFLRAGDDLKSLSGTISFFFSSFIFCTLLLEILTAGWLFGPTCMSCSSPVMLFPKICHASALCYGLLEVNVFWMDLQRTVYSGCVQGEILCGFAATYQKQLWNPRHLWVCAPQWVREECISEVQRNQMDPSKSLVWGAAAQLD